MIPEGAVCMALFLDGNQWCCVDNFDFTCIQECCCGFGDTRMEAVANFLKDAGYE